MTLPTRKEMIAALDHIGIQVQKTTSISNIRTMYDANFNSEKIGDLTTYVPDVTSAMQTKATSAVSTSVSVGSLLPLSVTTTPITTTVQLPIVNTTASAVTVTEETLEDMTDEIIRLETRERLLELRAKVAKMEAEATSNLSHVKRRVKTSDVDSLVSTFSGSDDYVVSKWMTDFEDVMTSLDADDSDRYRMARHLLKGTAELFLRTIRATSWNELREALLKRFDRQVSAYEIYEKLRRRIRRSDETIVHYVTCMQETAMRANIPEKDLISFIVSGIRDTSGYVTMLASAQTIEQLIDSVPTYEQLVLYNRLNTTNSTGAKPKTSDVRKLPASTAAFDQLQPRCYNCSKFGHMSADCPAPRRASGSCFSCGSTEHKNINCPKRKKIVAAVTQPTSGILAEEIEELSQAVSSMACVSIAFGGKLKQRTQFSLISSLLDTGSPTSFLRRGVLPGDVSVGPLCKSAFVSIGNQPIYTYGKIQCYLRIRQQIKLVSVLIVPDHILPVDLLVGRDILQIFNIQLYFERLNKVNSLPLNQGDNVLALDTVDAFASVSDLCDGGYTLNTCLATLFRSELVKGDSSIDHSNAFAPMASSGSDLDSDFCLLTASVNSVPDVQYDIDPKLGLNMIRYVEECINTKYLGVDSSDINVLDYEMRIHLENDVPFYTHPRRLSVKEKQEVRLIIRDLLHRGTIRPSESPYASPIVLVRKKNGETRMCVDYRTLNKITVRDNYPLPLMDDCLEYLSNKRVFSLLDLKSGFHQVRVSEESIKYTSFVTPEGQFEYLCMPFGLKNAPSVFQRFINKILRKFIDSGQIVVYLDDILIASETIDEHLKLLGQLLRCIAVHGLELQLGKCKFAYSTIEYLGFVVSGDGIRPGTNKLNAVRQYPVPTNIRQLYSFIGLCSFFRRFIAGFARIAAPLYRLLQKNAVFDFNDDCFQAFENLKRSLTSAPVLAVYDPTRETELHTDASKIGFGAAIMQKQGDSKFHPVAYFSKTISKHEINYHSYELETLAIVYALLRFRVYLEGIPFTIVTDCNSLVLTFNKRDVNSRIARWVWEFEKYNYKIKHRHGTQMSHVDALSRNPIVAFVDTSDIDFKLRLTQNRDPVIMKLKELLETSESPVYEMRDGIIYRKSKENRLLFFVPREMEQQLIGQVHERIGHYGSAKCYEKIKEHYWFANMKDKIDSFVKNCFKCIMHSAPPRSTERALYSIPKKPVPFDTIHLDHFGPLPSVVSKRKHLLVIIDSFTKYVRLYPVNSTSTKEVCCSLDKYFDYYSRPARMITDRGTCFTSSEFASYAERLNIRHVKVAVASPQANGQVERVNRVLKNMLGKLTEPLQHSDWTKKLKHVEYALNNTLQRSVGTTPSRLLFGVDQRGPEIDFLGEYLSDKELNTVNRDLDALRDAAAASIKRSQEYNQKWFDEHCRPAKNYEPGDFVVIRHVDTTPGTNKKFVPHFRGPYVVHKSLPNDRYVIRDIEDCQITQLPYDGIVEARHMKMWGDGVAASAPNAMFSEA